MGNWQFKLCKEYKEQEITIIIPQILNVFANGMGREGWSFERIKEQLNASTWLGLLKVQDTIMGYFFATIPEKQFEGKNLLWIDAVCVLKDKQNKGYFNSAIFSLKSLSPKTFGYYGLRTQNPAMMYALDKLCEGVLVPFDTFYSPNLTNFLVENVYEVRKPYELQNLDEKNGICKKVYKEGKLGDYLEEINKGRSAFFEDLLQKWQFTRTNGDAIILVKQA